MPIPEHHDLIADAVASPTGKVVIAAAGVALIATLAREFRRIPKGLLVLMATAFVDMVGVFFVIPILPFYVERLVGNGLPILGFVLGAGLVAGSLGTAFQLAQSLSAPMWGRFSDRFGRRPTLLVALGASALAYVVFGFAESIAVLLLSRIVQGAGGGTVGVIQAYVADTVAPSERTRALGWLSAATNLGVALGPAIGTIAVQLGGVDLLPGEGTWTMGHAAPGIAAALLCVLNMAFAARNLRESNTTAREPKQTTVTARGAAWTVLARWREPQSRLILIYAIAIGASQGVNPVLGLFLGRRFHVDEHSIGFVFMYIGALSVFARVLLLGRMVDRFGEARLSRLGVITLAGGLSLLPFVDSLPTLAIAVGLIPLGTAWTFPCVSGLLSRVVTAQDRGMWLGLQQTYGGFSRMGMPLLCGMLFDHVGEGVPFFVAAGFVLCTLLLGRSLDTVATPPAAKTA